METTTHSNWCVKQLDLAEKNDWKIDKRNKDI